MNPSEWLVTATIILIEHFELIKELSKFSDLLGVPRYKSELLIQQCKSLNIEAYECVKKILEMWEVRWGTAATKTRLFEVLQKMGLVRVLENLQAELNRIPETQVQSNDLNPKKKMLSQFYFYHTSKPNLSYDDLEEFLTFSDQLISGDVTESCHGRLDDIPRHVLLVCIAIKLMIREGSHKSLEEVTNFCARNQNFVKLKLGTESRQFLQLKAAEARIYYTWRQFDRATEIGEVVYDKQMKLSKDSLDLRTDAWTTAVDLALCYWNNERQQDALLLLRNTLDAQKMSLSKSDPIIVETERVYRALKGKI